MATLKYPAKKYQSGEITSVLDVLTAETPLKITVNGQVFTITMCTPGNENALVRGLLFAENVYRDLGKHPTIKMEERDNQGFVTAVSVVLTLKNSNQGELGNRNLMSVASCGICGNTTLPEPIPHLSLTSKKGHLAPVMVLKMFREMTLRQDTFLQSGGSHAAAAFDVEGRLLTHQEDIGRHNAVDKVVGQLIMEERLPEAYSIVVSGRVSYEIVSKAYIAGIPVLAAVSAPSSLAVDCAQRFGMTLLAFCRDEKFTIYCGEERILK